VCLWTRVDRATRHVADHCPLAFSFAEKTLYLHIGAPRVASSHLQKQFFPHLEKVCYLRKPRAGFVEGAYATDGIFAAMYLQSPAVWNRFGDELFSLLPERGGAGWERESRVLVADENMCVIGVDATAMDNGHRDNRNNVRSVAEDTWALREALAAGRSRNVLRKVRAAGPLGLLQ